MAQWGGNLSESEGHFQPWQAFNDLSVMTFPPSAHAKNGVLWWGSNELWGCGNLEYWWKNMSLLISWLKTVIFYCIGMRAAWSCVACVQNRGVQSRPLLSSPLDTDTVSSRDSPGRVKNLEESRRSGLELILGFRISIGTECWPSLPLQPFGSSLA